MTSTSVHDRAETQVPDAEYLWNVLLVELKKWGSVEVEAFGRARLRMEGDRTSRTLLIDPRRLREIFVQQNVSAIERTGHPWDGPLQQWFLDEVVDATGSGWEPYEHAVLRMDDQGLLQPWAATTG